MKLWTSLALIGRRNFSWQPSACKLHRPASSSARSSLRIVKARAAERLDPSRSFTCISASVLPQSRRDGACDRRHANGAGVFSASSLEVRIQDALLPDDEGIVVTSSALRTHPAAPGPLAAAQPQGCGPHSSSGTDAHPSCRVPRFLGSNRICGRLLRQPSADHCANKQHACVTVCGEAEKVTHSVHWRNSLSLQRVSQTPSM